MDCDGSRGHPDRESAGLPVFSSGREQTFDGQLELASHHVDQASRRLVTRSQAGLQVFVGVSHQCGASGCGPSGRRAPMDSEHGAKIVHTQALDELPTEDAPLLVRQGRERIVECGLDDIAVTLAKKLEPRIHFGSSDLREDGRSHRNLAIGSVATQEIDRHPAGHDSYPALK